MQDQLITAHGTFRNGIPGAPPVNGKGPLPRGQGSFDSEGRLYRPALPGDQLTRMKTGPEPTLALKTTVWLPL